MLFASAAAKFSKVFPIELAHTTVTSGSPESLFAVTQGASMASEPAVITEEQSVDELIWRVYERRCQRDIGSALPPG
jgi:hypothetical protein